MNQLTEMLTPKEVASALNVTKPTLGNWRARGIGPPYLKIGKGTLRYPYQKLVQWIEEREISKY